MLTTEQHEALQLARNILEKAGLLNSPPGSPVSEVTRLKDLYHSKVELLPLPKSSSIIYHPPASTSFSSEAIFRRENRVTSKTTTQKIVKHNRFAVVEFPETGESEKEAVAHIFPVSSEQEFDPKLNLQYSIWGKHGSHENVTCYLLRDRETSMPPKCHQFKAECKSTSI